MKRKKVDGFPDFVRTLRKKLGVNQKGFSRLFGIPFQTIRNWEQGICQPDRTGMLFLYLLDQYPTGILNLLRANSHIP